MGYTGIPFEVVVSEAEELSQGAPDELVRENARLKGMAVAKEHPEDVVLSADTLVYLPHEKKVLGKPATEEEAVQMLLSMQGKWHEVYTGVCVICGEKQETQVDVARVLFDELDENVIRQYVSTKEPMDKAGSYGIQEKGCVLVKGICGDYFNVVGLPVAALYRVLNEIGGLNADA